MNTFIPGSEPSDDKYADDGNVDFLARIRGSHGPFCRAAFICLASWRAEPLCSQDELHVIAGFSCYRIHGIISHDGTSATE